MKVFRVVMQGPDGPLQKEDGKSVQLLRDEITLYAAETIQQVWDHVAGLRQQGPWAELELMKVEEAAPAIQILRPPPSERTTP